MYYTEQFQYMQSNGNCILIPRLVDVNGKPVEKVKGQYPYSYDEYVMYRVGKNEEATEWVYSDRIFQWNYKKYNKLTKKHFGNHGQYWGHRNPVLIEKFLCDYFGKRIKLILILEGCNVSNGYPYWVFAFTDFK